jgi:hypothetical protein
MLAHFIVQIIQKSIYKASFYTEIEKPKILTSKLKLNDFFDQLVFYSILLFFLIH